MTASDTRVHENESEPQEDWMGFGIRLGVTRKAVSPHTPRPRGRKRLPLADRVARWHEEHRYVRKAPPTGRKPPESIYAIRIWSNPRFIKIGRSGETYSRFNMIRTSMPFYLEEIMRCTVENAARAEVALQTSFPDECVCGEWFYFAGDAEDEVVAALRECCDPPAPAVDVFRDLP